MKQAREQKRFSYFC